jgi:hypothetical protein
VHAVPPDVGGVDRRTPDGAATAAVPTAAAKPELATATINAEQ